MRNQPVEQIYGKGVKPDYRDIGVKWTFGYGKQRDQDLKMVVERKDTIREFLESNEAYTLESFDDIPEFAIADFDHYNNAHKMPFLRFHTNIRQDELLPLPDQHTLDYSKLHPHLERWTLFQSLPQIYNFTTSSQMLASQICSGMIKVPNYTKLVNIPTLWSYYETLPRWARNDPIVRNVMMAMEYKQPHLGIRQKEDALNFACSFLRPISQDLRKVLADAMASNKIQMNMKTGTKMLTELQFYTIDIEWLGSESEDYEGDEADTDILSSIRKQTQDEEEELTPMQIALKMMDDDNR